MWLIVQAGSLAAGCGVSLLAAAQVRPGPAGLLAALFAAVLFSLIYGQSHAREDTALFCLAAGAGAVAGAVDARHQLLPDLSTALIGLSGLLAAVLRAEAVNALLAAALAAGILALAARMTRRPGAERTLGEGDLLLAGACATWADPGLLAWCLVLAAGLTILSGAVSGAWRRGGRMPFGPGLLTGYAACVSAAPLLRSGAGGM
jgi:prepilin signal peptidase PulO-like enzyme (type II secretory pathway)